MRGQFAIGQEKLPHSDHCLSLLRMTAWIARITLFISQRINWIECGGFAGGVIAEEDADGETHAEGEDD